jgi:hypothetical protein
LLLWLGACTLLRLGMTATSDEDQTEYWTRLNYGLAAIKVKQVCEVEGFWHHVIHLELPQTPDGGIPEGPENRLEACKDTCTLLRELLRGTRMLVTSMQESVSRMIDRVNDLIPNLSADPHSGSRTPRTRTVRGLINAVDSASSYLFGTATKEQLNKLKETIKRIEAVAETGAADASRTREGLAEFTKLQNERLDSLKNVLREQHKSLVAIFRELRAEGETVSLGFEALSYMTTQIARYVAVHDNVQMLELGAEDLVHGQLTPRLVEVGILNDVLRNASKVLYRKGFELCFATPAEVYQGG